MSNNPSKQDLLEIINQALDDQGMSARQASILATGTPELIRNMRRGRVPSVENFRALCKVLNLEFYVGPMRGKTSISARTSNKKQTLYDMFQEIISRLPPPKSTYAKMAEPTKRYKSAKESDIYYIPIFEIDTNADKATIDESKQQASYVAFQSGWFDKNNIDPEHCVMLEVCDDAMEPTIANGSAVLADRSQNDRQMGCLYAIHMDGKLIVRRLGKNKDRWQLVGDNPRYETVLLPSSAEIIGEVKWAARTF